MASKILPIKELQVYIKDLKDFERFTRALEGAYETHYSYFYKNTVVHKYTYGTLYGGKSAYRMGYRRDISKEEIISYLSRKDIDYPWLNDWEEDLINQFQGDLEAINKHCWTEYRKRKPFFKDSFGDIGTKNTIQHLTLKKVTGEQVEITATKQSLEKHTIDEYVIEDSLDRHLISKVYQDSNGYSHILLEIITNSGIEECEDHPGRWGGYCVLCRDQYAILVYSANPLNYLNFQTGKEKVHLGVELEVDTSPEKVAPTLKPLKGFAIAKSDGSIDGFEIVTAPATFDVHAEKFKHFPWHLQYITKQDGMHVHIDRKKLNDTQIGKMFEFIYNEQNRDLINMIAGRSVDANPYCSNKESRGLLTNLEEKDEGIYRKEEGSHGTALNISYKGTLEVRIFQAPSTYERFMSNLEFVKALIAYTSPGVVSLKEVKDQSNFLNFLDRHTYPNLCNTIFGQRKEPKLCA